VKCRPNRGCLLRHRRQLQRVSPSRADLLVRLTDSSTFAFGMAGFRLRPEHALPSFATPSSAKRARQSCRAHADLLPHPGTGHA